jgi:divalent metal cation (Fe/Co/Zn/Cd) transporter
VDPELSVEAAHKIAEAIEGKVRSGIKPLENVTVHIEPAGEAIAAEQFSEIKMQTEVCDIAKSLGGNLEIKRQLTYVAEGKRHINIDCCFTKEVPIKEAHQVASLLEKQVREAFVNTVVTVHIEPQCKDQSLGRFI